MLFDELIEKINKSTDELDFATARRYVESNYQQLEENKHLLNTNARDILSLVRDWVEKGHEPISRPDMATINTINNYAKKFNVRGVKLAVKNSPKLFMRPDISDYLNNDAKTILEGMGVIGKDN